MRAQPKLCCSVRAGGPAAGSSAGATQHSAAWTAMVPLCGAAPAAKGSRGSQLRWTLSGLIARPSVLLLLWCWPRPERKRTPGPLWCSRKAAGPRRGDGVELSGGDQRRCCGRQLPHPAAGGRGRERRCGRSRGAALSWPRLPPPHLVFTSRPCSSQRSVSSTYMCCIVLTVLWRFLYNLRRVSPCLPSCTLHLTSL